MTHNERRLREAARILAEQCEAADIVGDLSEYITEYPAVFAALATEPQDAPDPRDKRIAELEEELSDYKEGVEGLKMAVGDLRDERDRLRRGVTDVRRRGGVDRPAPRRQRTAPLRVERVQRVPVPAGCSPAHGAPLPGGAGDRVVADSHPGHESESQAAEDREGDRAGRVH